MPLVGRVLALLSASGAALLGASAPGEAAVRYGAAAAAAPSSGGAPLSQQAPSALPPPPPALLPLDFVPDFSFRTRVTALDPAPAPGTANTSVLSVFVWGWGQQQSQTVGLGSWGPECSFTRNVTGAYWAAAYPNTYGLRAALPVADRSKQEKILVTQLFICHGGTFPCSSSTCGRDPNQTTTVEVEVTLDGKVSTLGATLKWGAEGMSTPPHCDDLGIVVGQKTKTGEHFVETFQQYNARKYWPAFDALPPSRSSPTKFALMDGFRTADCDLQATRDALRATKKLGLHGSQFGGSAVLGSSIPGGSAWLQKQEVGYALTAGNSEVALLECRLRDKCVIRSITYPCFDPFMTDSSPGLGTPLAPRTLHQHATAQI